MTFYNLSDPPTDDPGERLARARWNALSTNLTDRPLPVVTFPIVEVLERLSAIALAHNLTLEAAIDLHDRFSVGNASPNFNRVDVGIELPTEPDRLLCLNGKTVAYLYEWQDFAGRFSAERCQPVTPSDLDLGACLKENKMTLCKYRSTPPYRGIGTVMISEFQDDKSGELTNLKGVFVDA